VPDRSVQRAHEDGGVPVGLPFVACRKSVSWMAAHQLRSLVEPIVFPKSADRSQDPRFSVTNRTTRSLSSAGFRAVAESALCRKSCRGRETSVLHVLSLRSWASASCVSKTFTGLLFGCLCVTLPENYVRAES
jgi:hypothetical protein